jgi:hypothetical protein
VFSCCTADIRNNKNLVVSNFLAIITNPFVEEVTLLTVVIKVSMLYPSSSTASKAISVESF